MKNDNKIANMNNNLRKIIKPSNEELNEHENYLKNSLKGNFFG